VTDEQKNARFALAVLFGINLMNFFDRQIAGALLEPIRIEFGMNDASSAWVNTAFTLHLRRGRRAARSTQRHVASGRA
jgi:hypothetical protein